MSIKHQKNGTYVTTLSDFGGLDLTGADATSPARFSRLDNMWRDYHADATAIESFPGFRFLFNFSGTIHGVWQWMRDGAEHVIVHAGTTLYTCPLSATDKTVLASPPTVIAGGNGTLADAKSVGFCVGENFYLLDGTHYFAVTVARSIPTLTEVKNLYIPITYSDGVPYEMRNILSDKTINRYHIGDPAAYSCGSRGLHFRILDKTLRTCEVLGFIEGKQRPNLYIPAETVIGGVTYRVTSVAWKSFSYSSVLKQVFISEGVEEIGIVAFDQCTNLEYIYLPDSIKHIRRCAFRNCTSLRRLVLGNQLRTIDRNILDHVSGAEICFHGDEEDFAQIVVNENNPGLASLEVTYLDEYPIRVCRFPLYENIESIDKITLDGVVIPENTGSPHYIVDYTDNNYIGGVILHADSDFVFGGRELCIHLRLFSDAKGSIADKVDFAAGSGYDGPTHAALAHCTQAAIYDGRVFFTGNPQLGATVFYTARDLSGHLNPAYVGIYNYFLSGDGTERITALLPTSSYLAVLSGDSPDGGHVTYYHGADTNIDLVPRIYVTTDSVRGRGCAGMACTLRDDPVFLSHEGLEAISREALNTERSLKHRSSLVDPALLSHDPRQVLHAVWEGYLILLYPDGEAYLADSRRHAATSRGSEYEWYHLTGVGSHDNDLPVFRYADAFFSADTETVIYDGEETPLCLHDTPDELPFGCDYDTYPLIYPQIMIGVNPQGKEVAYTVEGTGAKRRLYLLCRTKERTGGIFSSPSALGVVGDKLFIGCENGHLTVVNTDRRGLMNESQAAAYDPAAYARQWGQLINPEWYSFAGHRYLSGLATLPDDSGVSNYTKGTLRGSTVLEMKAGVGYGFGIEVRLFRTTGAETTKILSATQGGLDFAVLNFGNIHFGACEDTTVVLNERSRRYLKKQYCLFSNSFARPFGLKRLAYTWQVEGKVKNV